MPPILEATILQPEAAPAAPAHAPLSDWQRRRLLIAAAATAAVGAPVRIISISPAEDPARKWKRAGRIASHAPRRSPWRRKPASVFAPGEDVREGDQA